MSDPKSSQSISISGSGLSGNQIGQAGQDLIQYNNGVQGFSATSLSRKEVIDLLTKLENIVVVSGLTRTQQDRILAYTRPVKEEARVENSDKQVAVANLKKATGIIKETSEVISDGKKIWQSVQPILSKLAPWFGVTASFFL